MYTRLVHACTLLFGNTKAKLFPYNVIKSLCWSRSFVPLRRRAPSLSLFLLLFGILIQYYVIIPTDYLRWCTQQPISRRIRNLLDFKFNHYCAPSLPLSLSSSAHPVMSLVFSSTCWTPFRRFRTKHLQSYYCMSIFKVWNKHKTDFAISLDICKFFVAMEKLVCNRGFPFRKSSEFVFVFALLRLLRISATFVFLQTGLNLNLPSIWTKDNWCEMSAFFRSLWILRNAICFQSATWPKFMRN